MEGVGVVQRSDSEAPSAYQTNTRQLELGITREKFTGRLPSNLYLQILPLVPLFRHGPAAVNPPLATCESVERDEGTPSVGKRRENLGVKSIGIPEIGGKPFDTGAGVPLGSPCSWNIRPGRHQRTN